MYQRRLSPSLHWHEGMFLQPHHFQQLSRWVAERLTFENRLLSPFEWGVHSLEVDEDAVLEGRLTIKNIEAIFEDGLVVQTHLLSRPLEKDLTPFESRLQGGEPLLVHLAVPTPGDKVVQVGEGDEASYPLRYEVRGEKVNDESTGANEVLVDVLKVKATLLVGDEDRSGYQTIPVAEVMYSKGAMRLTDYIPPTILVTKESPIALLVRKLCGELRSRALKIAGSLDTAVKHKDLSQTLAARFRSLTMVPSLLPLEQMVECEGFRPLDIYLAVCRIVGELYVHEPEIFPPNLPRYNHIDLRSTFGRLAQLLPEHRGPEDWEKLEVETQKGSHPNSIRFIVKNLRKEHLTRPINFVVHAGVKGDAAALKRWVEGHCVIADVDHLAGYLRGNYLGMDRGYLDPPPIDLQTERGSVIYQLQLTDETAEPLEKAVGARSRNRDKALWFVSMDPKKNVLEKGEVVLPKVLEVYVKRK